jgi:hypothetical protein
MIFSHGKFKYGLIKKFLWAIVTSSKKHNKEKTRTKNTFNTKKEFPSKKLRYYAFGYLINDY